MNRLTIDQLDEIADIQACLSAIADLMVPSTRLEGVNRDDLALLLRYFTNRLNKTITLDRVAIDLAKIKMGAL
ncbi:MAG: hypothetical protein WCS87_01720 [Methylococcaceae bacterium]